LAPATYIEDDQRRRRLLVGLIPVGDRERLLQAGQPKPAGANPLPALVDAPGMLLRSPGIGPLQNLEDTADGAVQAIQAPGPVKGPPLVDSSDAEKSARTNSLAIIERTAKDQIQQVSWYILLDLMRYFQTSLNDLWQAIQNGDGSSLNSSLSPIWN